MDFNPAALVKKYPLQTVGVTIGVVGIVYIYIRRRGSSGGVTTVSSGADPVLAQYDLQLKQMQMSLSRDAQAGQLQYDYNLANLEASLAATKLGYETQLAISKDNNAAGLAATTTAANVSLAQIKEQSNIQAQQIQADLTANQNMTAVQRDMINANLASQLAGYSTQQNITSILANQQVALADLNARVQITSVQENASIQRAYIKMLRADSTNRMVGQIVGSVAGVAGGFI
jgi:hypothetical protein